MLPVRATSMAKAATATLERNQGDELTGRSPSDHVTDNAERSEDGGGHER